MTLTPLSRSKGQKVKGQGHQAALVGCIGRPTWTYSNGDLSICIHDVYRVTTCRPGRGHIVAAAHLQLVYILFCKFYVVSVNCRVNMSTNSLDQSHCFTFGFYLTCLFFQRSFWIKPGTLWGLLVRYFIHAGCLSVDLPTEH